MYNKVIDLKRLYNYNIASYTITINSSGVTVATGTEAATLKADFENVSNVTKLGDLKFESTEGKAITAITIVCQNTSPMVTVSEDTNKFDEITSK